MTSSEGANDRRVSPDRFGMVRLVYLPHWIQAGLVTVQGAVLICLLSWPKEDEAGRLYSWFPADYMAELLGVPRRSISDAIRRLKERGLITVKEKGRKRQCTEYYLNANVGTLNQPKEKAPTVAAASANNNGSVASSSRHASLQTHDPIIPVQSGEGMENGRCLPVDPPPAEGKPAFSRTGMTPERFAALKKMGAFSNCYQ